MFKEGIQRAKELDEQLKTTGKLAGPLHGLPISLKVYIINSKIKNSTDKPGFIPR
jgi:Asp-tRNA(Asn)/Glu-tRNA(Gln) amidotransferase A subunit family amidase